MDQAVLTRFYFNIRNHALLEDPDGSDLRDLAAARMFALRSARELWSNAMLAGNDLCDDQFEIMNEAGECLAVVPFGEALPDSMQKRLSFGNAGAASSRD